MLERLRIDNWSKWIDFTSGGIFADVLKQPMAWINEVISRWAFRPVEGKPAYYWESIQGRSMCCYSAHYIDPITERYIDMLKEFTGYSGVALFSTGSEATEAFWRMMRVYTGKPGIWGGLLDPDEVGKDKPEPPYDAMHGMTLGAMIMAGKMSFNGPGCFNWIGYDFFGRPQEQTGCAIFEPYHAPSAQWHREHPTMERIRSNMKHFPDIHFCCDEVQAGFGRTGKLFGYQWYPDLKPEFVTIGKAMGGGLPLSAVLGPKEIMEDPVVVEHAHMHSTHSGNPLMCAAGIAVIEAIQKGKLIEESYRKGLILAELLKDCGVRYHAGRGLLAGLEFAGPLEADKVVEAGRRRGLLTVSTGRKWVKLGPAYTITDDELEKGVKLLKEAIEETLNETCRDSGQESESVN